MTDVAVERRQRFPVAVGVTAVGLGLLAFVADLVDGTAGHVLIALTSSGLAWGLAAFVVGRHGENRLRAAVGGAVLLVTATRLLPARAAGRPTLERRLPGRRLVG